MAAWRTAVGKGRRERTRALALQTRRLWRRHGVVADVTLAASNLCSNEVYGANLARLGTCKHVPLVQHSSYYFKIVDF